MTKQLFEFHLYLRLSPKLAQLLFGFLDLNWEAEGGSYYMPINEDEVGSFDKAFDAYKNGEGEIKP